VSVPSSESGSPTPLPQASVSAPLDPKGGEEQHSLVGEEVGGPNSDDWKERHSIFCDENYERTLGGHTRPYRNVAMARILHIIPHFFDPSL
jgi:hypothetical protein